MELPKLRPQKSLDQSIKPQVKEAAAGKGREVVASFTLYSLESMPTRAGR